MTTELQTAYENMTRQERRIAIAKDVIANVTSRRIGHIGMGSYCSFALGTKPDVLDQETVQNVMPSCTVCARGAMMLTRIANYNSVELDIRFDVVDSLDTLESLEDAFDLRALQLIEAAFEQNWGFAAPEDRRVEVARRAVSFGERFYDPRERLVAIMQNIIDHDGDFKP